jgi:hypothetical protein
MNTNIETRKFDLFIYQKCTTPSLVFMGLKDLHAKEKLLYSGLFMIKCKRNKKDIKLCDDCYQSTKDFEKKFNLSQKKYVL